MALAEFGKNPQGGVSRVAYSDADKQGREYVLGLMKAASLDVTIDAAGNLIGRRAGSDSNLKPLLIGSHIDSASRKVATTTASSAQSARLKSPRHSRKTTRHCDIRWKLSFFRTRRAG